MKNIKLLLRGCLIILLLVTSVGVAFYSGQKNDKELRKENIVDSEAEMDFEELFKEEDSEQDDQEQDADESETKIDNITESTVDRAEMTGDSSENEVQEENDVSEITEDSFGEEEIEDTTSDFTESEDRETDFGPIL